MPVQQQAQPFSEYLDPAQVAPDNQRIRWDQGQQFSGWGGKAEAAAGLFSKFAEGLSQGKLQAFQKNQQQGAAQLKIISDFVQGQMQRTDLSEAKKNDLLNQQNRAYARILYPQLKEHAKAEGVAGHLAKGFSAVFGKMAGVNEAGKVNPYGPDDFHDLLSSATADVEDPANTVQAKIDQANEVWRNGITRINEAARARGPLPATFGEVEASREYQTALGLYRQAGQAHAAQFAQSVKDAYPDAKDYKARAAIGYENVSAQEAEALKKRALPDIPPSAAPPQGYLARQPGYLESQIPLAAATPPDFPTTPGESGRVRPMTQQEKTEDEQHQQYREFLGGILGIKPDVYYRDAGGNLIPMPAAQANSLIAQDRLANLTRNTTSMIENRDSLIKFRGQRFELYRQDLDHKWKAANERLSIAQQNANTEARRANIAALQEGVSQHTLEDKMSARGAVSNILLDAAYAGYKVDEIPAHIDELIRNSPDPETVAYAADIYKFASGIKKGQDYSALAAALSGNPAPAAGSPPAAATAAPPKPAVPTGGAGAQIFNQLRKPGK